MQRGERAHIGIYVCILCIYKGKTYVRARTDTYMRLCAYIRVNMAASIGKLHPKTRRDHRVINYRYDDDQLLIRVTIIAIDLFGNQTYLKHIKKITSLAQYD